MTDDSETRAVVAGPDPEDLAGALRAEGVAVSRIEGRATRPALEDAGATDAHLFVLTDPRDATAVPVARDLNPSLRVVVYARESVPEFARPQVDLAVDPAVLGPDVVAEELAHG